MLTSFIGNGWLIDFEYQDDTILYYHVIGPVFFNFISPQILQKAIIERDIPVYFRKAFVDSMNQLPIISIPLMLQYAVMMHYCITREHIDTSAVIQNKRPSPEKNQISSKPFSAFSLEEIFLSPGDTQSNPHLTERALLSMVTDGNLDFHSVLTDAGTVSPGVRASLGNPVRQSKDSIITFIALCSRAAIAGGLPTETAYAIQNLYIDRVEELDSMTALLSLNHEMYQEFIQRVHDIKESEHISTPIRTCMAYIQTHPTEELTLSLLARDTGYSEYYLSRKFKKEVGSSVSDFILTVRLSAAKTMLASTSLSIQEISDMFHFCSRSYFSEKFREFTGLPPGKFRNQH